MLGEIIGSTLKVVFVGTAVSDFSNDIGFYHMHPRNKFWDLLEYSGIILPRFFPEYERKALRDTFATGRLTEELRLGFFWRKEAQLLKLGIGLTDLNRRVTVSTDDDAKAMPTPGDIKQFTSKIEKFKPGVVAFVTSVDVFVDCFTPLSPQATKDRGGQGFKIGDSEVWLLGSASGRPKNDEARERVFEDLATFLSTLKDK